jgi:class 3 adenylate cyclase/predicted ATPase
VRQIVDWLEKLGMSEYARRFAENRIDFSVLPDLTDQDLEKLGVVLGDRRKMLRAIAELGCEARSTPQGPAAAEPLRQDTAERRHLTLMFCDLVGSTELSAKFDPEDTREVILAYQAAWAGVMPIYDGFIAKFMGDGVLAYFGYPRAHEDDSERAVRAGLDIVAAVARINTRSGAKLQVRIGIATGLVVVGDLIGEGASQEQAVVGDTPNLAARLQGLAEPGTIVVGASTRRLLGDVFRLRTLGRREIKGLAQPVEAWAVEGVSPTESRFEAAHASGLTGFVGREEEINLLLNRKTVAWQGEGQIVLVSGEAGVGKSRLTAVLSECLATEPHTRLRYQCSPYHTNSALYPFISQLERAAAIRPDDPPERKLDKLEAMLAMGASRVQAVAPIFAALLSIPVGDHYPPLSLTPAQQRRQTLAALLDQLESLARRKPILCVFEDAHWADATSVELFDLMADRLRHLPILAIITFRPGFEPSWAGLPNVATLALGRLDRQQVQTIVGQVTGGRKLPMEVMQQIVTKTDGVPLFVEELTKAVLEAGILIEDAEGYRLDGPLPPLAIPATLHDSLMARLDHLASVKEIAQVGAAIGREFQYGLLQTVVARDEAGLRSALAQLEEAELVFRRGEPPEATYSFKHALVQDAAYESLLKSRRQVLHRRIGEALRYRFPTVAETAPELVAHHFTQAGLTEAAVEWWHKAGERALHSSAYKEAIAHLEKALDQAESLADGPPQRVLRLRLQTTYGYALLHGRGQSALQSAAAFARARELAAGIEDTADRFSAYYGLWAGSLARAELTPMQEVAEAFLKDVQGCPDCPEAGIAHRLFGSTRWFQGDYVGARAHLESALAAYDSERDRHLASRFGYHIGVNAMVYLARVLWALGNVDRAARLYEEALSLALTTGHLPTLAMAHGYAAGYFAECRKPDQTTPHAEALVDLAHEHGLLTWLPIGTFLLGWARWWAGDRDAEATMREGFRLAGEIGFRAFEPQFGTWLAEVEAEAGRVETGLATLDSQLATIEQTGERWYEAEVNRVRGELLLRLEPPDNTGAEAAYARAIEIARSQQTRTFELRAALSLAKLYHATGRTEDVGELLGPALVGFSAGPELPEVAEAERLLAEGHGYQTDAAIN